jgi:hypothetical protein
MISGYTISSKAEMIKCLLKIIRQFPIIKVVRITEEE